MVTSGNLRWGRGGLILPAAALLFFALPFAQMAWLPDGHMLRWGLVWLVAGAAAIVLLRRDLRADLLDGVAVLFFLWMALSLAWSPDARLGAEALTHIGPALLLFLVLRRVPAERIRDVAAPAVIIGVIVASLLGLKYAGMGNANFQMEALAVMIPLALGSPIGIGIAALGIVALAFTVSTIAKVVIAMWLVAWSFLALKAMRAWQVGVGIIGFAVLGGLLLFKIPEVRWGAESRLDLWLSTAAAWFDKFWIGWGAGSFNFIIPAYGNVGLGIRQYSPAASTFPGAAHNDFLQLAMEGGVIALVLAGVGAWFILRKARGINRVALLTFAGLALVGFPFQNPVALMGAILAAACVVGPPAAGARIPPVRAAGVGAGALSLMLLVTLPDRLVSESHLSATYRHLSTDVVGQEAAPLIAVYHANEAYKLTPWRFETRLALFQATALSHKRLGLPPEQQVDEAWRIAQTASPLNPSMLITRLGYLDRLGRCPEECAEIMRLLLATAWRKHEIQVMIRNLEKTNNI